MSLVSARVETLAPSDSVQVLLRYREQHALAARELSRLMGLNISKASPDELERMVQESLPVVAIRPRQHKS